MFSWKRNIGIMNFPGVEFETYKRWQKGTSFQPVSFASV
jgi:hypothetical protein